MMVEVDYKLPTPWTHKEKEDREEGTWIVESEKRRQNMMIITQTYTVNQQSKDW